MQLIKDHAHSEQWKHIDTQENVPDYVSRGMPAKQLITDTRWFHGPACLCNPVLPIDFDERCNTILTPNDPEAKARTLGTIHSAESHNTMIERLKQFSDWNRLKTAFALCMGPLSNLRNWSVNSTNGLEPLNVHELRKAEIYILKLVQQEAFSEDLRVLEQQFSADDSAKSDRQTKRRKRIVIQKVGSRHRLYPFLDKDGLLRIGGRLRQANIESDRKHPVILPKKHHITQLIIHHFHVKTWTSRMWNYTGGNTQRFLNYQC